MADTTAKRAARIADRLEGSLRTFRRDNDATQRAIELLREVAAAQAPADLPAVIEQIAQQWDGCEYDGMQDERDIGKCIRTAGRRLLKDASQALAEPLPHSWRAERLDEFTVRITPPTGTAWRICWAEADAGFDGLMWRLACDMAAAVDSARSQQAEITKEA